MMSTKQTPLRKLIYKWNKQMEEGLTDGENKVIYVNTHDLIKSITTQFIKDSEALLSEEKQMVIDAYNEGDLRDWGEHNNDLGVQYFNETFEQ